MLTKAQQATLIEDPITYATKSDSPGICFVLWIIGWAGIAISVVFIVDSLSTDRASSASTGFAGAIFSLLLIAAGSALDRLEQIRHHAKGILLAQLKASLEPQSQASSVRQQSE